MSAAVAALEIVQTAVNMDDDGPDHAVCHCSGDRISWCGLDVTECGWLDDDEPIDCPLCGLMAERYPDCCPWGCRCEEC